MSNDLYTNLADAVLELKRRRADVVLRKKVEEYLELDIPTLLDPDKGLYSLLQRNIITPDFETKEFIEHSRKYSLTPTFFEYLDDLFIAENEDKHALGKLYFYLNTDKTGRSNMFGRKIIDFATAQKSKIRDIVTLSGEKLYDFHHRHFIKCYPELSLRFSDLSMWFKRHGPAASKYYKAVFALCIYHTILFENFRHDDGGEDEFTQTVVMPAWNAVCAEFNIKPLICPVVDVTNENDIKWMGYENKHLEHMV